MWGLQSKRYLKVNYGALGLPLQVTNQHEDNLTAPLPADMQDDATNSLVFITMNFSRDRATMSGTDPKGCKNIRKWIEEYIAGQATSNESRDPPPSPKPPRTPRTRMCGKRPAASSPSPAVLALCDATPKRDDSPDPAAANDNKTNTEKNADAFSILDVAVAVGSFKKLKKKRG